MFAAHGQKTQLVVIGSNYIRRLVVIASGDDWDASPRNRFRLLLIRAVIAPSDLFPPCVVFAVAAKQGVVCTPPDPRRANLLSLRHQLRL